MVTLKKFLSKNSVYIAWIIALIGTVGSLILSEFMHLPPCSLCWYQRILLYPLVIIIPVGIMKKDHFLHSYVIPFGILGMIVAAYHYLLQAEIIPENLVPCSVGVPCTEKYFTLLGFITIPLFSFAAFTAITMAMYLFKKSPHKYE